MAPDAIPLIDSSNLLIVWNKKGYAPTPVTCKLISTGKKKRKATIKIIASFLSIKALKLLLTHKITIKMAMIKNRDIYFVSIAKPNIIPAMTIYRIFSERK